MTLDPDKLSDLIKDCKTKEDIFGEEGAIKQLVKGLVENALEGELTAHLGYSRHDVAGQGSGNSRNGHSHKQVQGDYGKLNIKVPRDREGEFEPQLISKHQRRFDGFDEKIIAMYARGMSTRDMQAQLEELYGVDVSPTLISQVTDAVMEDVQAWQSRPLAAIYPIVYLDALRVKVKQDKAIRQLAVYLVLGVNTDGRKELLGMWVSRNEGAKFWLGVLTELKNRGVQDILIACVDGLKGFPDTMVQLCIVHKVRQSLRYVRDKDQRPVIQDLKAIYHANTLEEAELALTTLEERWQEDYPSLLQIWRGQWEYVIPIFRFPQDIRKAIYTTNAIESLNASIRKVIRHKRVFPSEQALFKQLYLAINNIAQKWTMPITHWKPALNRFMIEFEGRIPL